MATKIKDHTAIARSQLTRVLEAVARIEYPNDTERTFRVLVMKRLHLITDLPALTDDAQQERALDVRTLEAACKIDRPNPEERAFRLMTMGKLGAAFQLDAMRRITLGK